MHHRPDSVVVDAPLHRFLDHSAAVKALAWSPHQVCIQPTNGTTCSINRSSFFRSYCRILQRGLLASGGGTADRSIRFWNALTGEHLQKRDTDSQVSIHKPQPQPTLTPLFSLHIVVSSLFPSPSRDLSLRCAI